MFSKKIFCSKLLANRLKIWYTYGEKSKGAVFMKKSPVKTVFKSIFLTLGILAVLYSLINPLIYHFGSTSYASCDKVDFIPIEGSELYTCRAEYHYFVSGEKFSGSISYTTPFDETVEYDRHTVKYFPLLPSFGIIDLGYEIPRENYIFFCAGAVFLLIGLFIKTKKKVKKIKEDAVPEKAFKCPACQREIDSDSIYCNYCGRKIIM